MRRFRATSVLAALLLTATACGSSDDSGDGGGGGGGSDELDQVTVGVIPIIDVAPIYLGDEQGFFTDRGIELTLELAQGGAAIVPAVLSGDTQFGFSNVVSMFIASNQGLPVRMIAPGASSTGVQGEDFQGIAVGADSDIESAADLEGKTVGVNTLNNICGVSIDASVRAAGGDPSKVNYVEIPSPDAPAALENGDVDADCMGEPFLTVTLAAGGRIIASNFVDVAPDATIATYFTAQPLLDSDPDLVQRFTEAMQESLSYADEHPDEARQIVTTYTQITADVLADVTLPRWPAEFNTDSLTTIADNAQESGVIDMEPDFDTLLP